MRWGSGMRTERSMSRVVQHDNKGGNDVLLAQFLAA
jgi:hypothetical protein